MESSTPPPPALYQRQNSANPNPPQLWTSPVEPTLWPFQHEQSQANSLRFRQVDVEFNADQLLEASSRSGHANVVGSDGSGDGSSIEGV
eukprot:scaffold15824_cov269-Alexandrium_tamarense.AAC.2